MTTAAGKAGMNRVVFSSATVEWETPQALFDSLNAEFGFAWDVCATSDNAKCSLFWSTVEDGLVQPWSGRCWMNPPYGYGIGAWTRKARTEAAAGAIVVGLLPAKTETRWWRDDVWAAAKEIRLVSGRLRFGGCNVNAPFPSAVVVWSGKRAAGAGPSVTLFEPSRKERGCIVA